MDLAERVKTLLEDHFPGAAVNVDSSPYSEKLSGYLVWSGFENEEQIERQNQVISWLRQNLGPQARLVSIILTYSTSEYQMMSMV